jgi:hypothetical protein
MSHATRQTIAALLLAGFALGCAGERGVEPANSAEPANEPATTAVAIPPKVVALEGTQESVFALAGAILAAIEADEFDALMSLRVSEAEFYHLVWPQLPSARPERNLSWDYVWRDLDQKSRNSARRTLQRHEGRPYRLIRVEFAGETTDYETYRVHRDARVVVEDASGEIRALDLFGSVIEMGGRYKAFSFVVD